MLKDYIEIDENNSVKEEKTDEIKETNVEKTSQSSYSYNLENDTVNQYFDIKRRKDNHRKIEINDLDLDSKKKTKLKSPSRKENTKGKWVIILTLGIILYFAYQPMSNLFILYLKNNPSLYKYYLFIFSQINNNTILGLFMVSILGALFFLVLPSEAIFIYYLDSTQYNPMLVIGLVILGSLVGLTFNYTVGKLLGKRFIKLLFRKNFQKYQNLVNKYGSTFIFLGNIIPGPMEVLSVFFGCFKYEYKNFIILSMLGRLIKYMLLFLAFTFFWETITHYYLNFINIL